MSTPRAHLPMLAATVLVLLSAVACSTSPRPVLAPERAERAGFRFQRADLVDVASFVAEASGKPVLIEDPEWRTLTLSLYSPVDVEPAALEALFAQAIAGLGLELRYGDGVLLVAAAPALAGQLEAVEGGYRVALVDASVTELCGRLSELLGKRFVLASELGWRTVSIQAQQPVSGEELLGLFVLALEAEGLGVAQQGDVYVIREAAGAAQ